MSKDNNERSSREHNHQPVLNKTNASANKPASATQLPRTTSFKNVETVSKKVRAGYKAAGILLLRERNFHIEGLFCVERRNTNLQLSINFIGGQKGDTAETFVDTAVREFREETNFVWKKQFVLQRALQSSPCWLKAGKYVLLICPVASPSLRTDSEVLKQFHASKRKSFESTHIEWIRINAIFGNADKQSGYSVSKYAQKIPVSKFINRIRTDPTLCQQLNIVTKQLLQSAIVESKNAQVKAKLTSNKWKLQLQTPTIPPSPIQLVDPQSQQYKQLVSKIPSPYNLQVCSIRKTFVKERNLEYINATAKLNGNYIEVYHGTPDTWRATAIALNGFNLKLRLNGRSLGHGVYTSTSPKTPLSYTRQVGSLLYMNGFITASGNNVVSDNEVVVFKNEKHVIPVYIYDFSTAKPNVVKNKFKDQQQRVAILKKTAQSLETHFINDQHAQQKAIILNFQAAVKSINNTLNVKLTTGRANNVDSSLIAQAELKLVAEYNQFNNSLPIYASKQRIITTIQATFVTIVVAETGSGKSTQIPQYVRDNIFPSATRAVIVLEPKRVNATSLCYRVSKEREVEPGTEIGYKIGLGKELLDNKEMAPITYMTHGKFIQFARAGSIAHLSKLFCAIIVDEAHERSVEVDLTLAILKKLCDMQTKPPDFRIIVMSATISQKQQSKLKHFLDPSNSHSKCISIPGRTFPVILDYRDELALASANEVGTAGVGQIISAYAIRTCLDLLDATTTGNILVFFPGKGNISSALSVAYQVLSTNATNLGAANASVSDGFIAHLKLPCSGKKVIGVFPFHGALSQTAQARVLDPHDVDRLVVFTTNVAETGLTVPDVRYVVDTGLQKTVSWNKELNIKQMTTSVTNKSSANQRAGRAGRVGTGICIRLYSKKQFENMNPAGKCIEDGDITKVILFEFARKEKMSQLQYLDPIPDEARANAINTLIELGALSTTNSETSLTKEGKLMLQIGLNLRLSKFLIVCHNNKCLESGVRLAAILSSSTYLSLIPSKGSLFIDDRGDHFTLLRIFSSFLRQPSPKAWSCNNQLNYATLQDIKEIYLYLKTVISNIKQPSMVVKDNAQNISDALLISLAAGFCNYVGDSLNPGSPGYGFAWLCDKSMLQQGVNALDSYYGSTQPNNAPVKSNGSVIKLQLTSTSVLHKSTADNIGRNKNSNNVESHNNNSDTIIDADSKRFIIFSSILLTDGGTQAITIECASYIRAEHLQEGASKWCQHVQLNNVLKRKIITKSWPITKKQQIELLWNKAEALRRISRKLGNSVILRLNSNKTKVVATAPETLMDVIEMNLQKLHSKSELEQVIDIPDCVKTKDVQGAKQKQLKMELSQILARHLSYASCDKIVNVSVANRKITIKLIGPATAFSSILVAYTLNFLQKHFDLQQLPTVQYVGNPRLAALLLQQSPSITTNVSRQQLCLLLAHHLIHAGYYIYGGFVRDWIINGDQSNDIDVLLPSDTSIQQAYALLKALSDKVGFVCSAQPQPKNVAQTYTISWPQHEIKPIDVDFVPSNCNAKKTKPYVDSSAGNVMITKAGLAQKVTNPKLLSLKDSMKLISKRQFVLYYEIDSERPTKEVIHRLTKYIVKKGFTCLTPIPQQLQEQHFKGFEDKIKPKACYDRKWWV